MTRPTPLTAAKNRIVRVAPSRWTTTPETGIATSAPVDTPSSSRPTCSGARPSASRTAGTREARLANANPLSANVTKTAQAAASGRPRRAPAACGELTA